MDEDRKEGAREDAGKSGGEVKTAQPFSEKPAEPYADMGGGSPNKPRPDQVDDPAAEAESWKTTQRQE